MLAPPFSYLILLYLLPQYFSPHHVLHKPFLHTNFPHNIFYQHNFSHIILSHTLHYTLLFIHLFPTPSFTIPFFTMYSLSHIVFFKTIFCIYIWNTLSLTYHFVSHTTCHHSIFLTQFFSHRRSFTSRFLTTFLTPLQNIFHTIFTWKAWPLQVSTFVSRRRRTTWSYLQSICPAKFFLFPLCNVLCGLEKKNGLYEKGTGNVAEANSQNVSFRGGRRKNKKNTPKIRTLKKLKYASKCALARLAG